MEQIKHRMFSYVSLNWRGKPLESLQVIIDLIGSTRTSTGLKVYARLDPGDYEIRIKVTDQQLVAVTIERDQFHPDWNYTIQPTASSALILIGCGSSGGTLCLAWDDAVGVA
ncbi:MAG: ISAzo13-like element transposase-related protein [Solirubrobacteraceae bacterium]